MLYNPNQKFDGFSHLFDAQDLHLILKSRVDCLRAGFAVTDPIVQTLDEIRQTYVKKVGISTYIQEMIRKRNKFNRNLNEVEGGNPEQLDNQPEIEFDFSDTATIQLLLEKRVSYLKMDMAIRPFDLNAFDNARRTYIDKVGISQYLTQMLGSLGDIPSAECKFFLGTATERQVEFSEDTSLPLQQLLQKYFHQRQLYLKITIPQKNTAQRQIRYI